MNIIIIGPQGSGKGTQAELIAEHYDLLHIESGEILRDLAKSNKRIDKMVDSGAIVPDKETLKYISNYINERKWGYDNIIFDGYPRKRSQYKLLTSWLEKKGMQIDLVIYLEIDDKEAVRRLSARRVCEKCGEVYNLITKPPKNKLKCRCGGKLIQRDDDEPRIIQKRLGTFHKRTEPILKLIKKDGTLFKVDGERPIEVIFDEIVSVVDKHVK